jgi:hypothetical protein
VWHFPRYGTLPWGGSGYQWTVGLRTTRRRLGVHDAGDDPADRIVEDRVIVDCWTGVDPSSAADATGQCESSVTPVKLMFRSS